MMNDRKLEHLARGDFGRLMIAAALMLTLHRSVAAEESNGANLAVVAKPTTSYVSGHETINALNDGVTPRHSNDKTHGAYGNWPRTGAQWVEYQWSQPISTRKVGVYWFDDHGGVRLPKGCRVKYWDGSAFVEVPGATGLGLEENKFNTTTFGEITTTRLRLEFDSTGGSSTGLLDWRVYDSGKSPNFPPTVAAGVERVVVQPAKTYLTGAVKDDGKPKASPTVLWSKQSGPGKVIFDDATEPVTEAKFSAPGEYVLSLTADDGKTTAKDTLKVLVESAPPKAHLTPVWTAPYKVTSPFWQARLKPVIENWIPHCIDKIDDPKVPEGGIENFAQAGKKNAGEPAQHTGPPFANAWVYNTFESMCLALTIDANGDRDVLKAQEAIRQKVEEWTPKLLSAQEPDGYLQTMYTIRGIKRWTNKHDHEGYNAGYFMEAAMAHYQMTGGKDKRMLEAAKRLADCWYNNIGPAPKRAWYEGHQELEMALVRLARFVEQLEGPGKGRKYVELSRFLMDSRKDGDEYDQSHQPITRQYEAVGHAVRAVYCYAGLADLVMETRDPGYASAAKSLWHSIVNKKYYVTGGVGSGETSEGFGKEYSLPNNAYCESCAGSGELFFQHKMQMIYQESRYADLYEETFYNAILGGLDLEGQNFTYTNPLDSSGKRYKWHVCPCCVGNLPRTLLMAPTWMYTKGQDSLYVNLFVGSTVDVGEISGTPVQVVQATDYPWKGDIAVTVKPAKPAKFTLKLRVPDRNVSELYAPSPACGGVTSLVINGKQVKPKVEHGYVSITRKWTAGDKVEMSLPMQVQKISPSEKIAATRGRVALRYGPLIYNIESVDQDVDSVLKTDAALTTEWKPDLLGGVMVIKGQFANGSPLLAIPNYARLNRGGRSTVWIKAE